MAGDIEAELADEITRAVIKATRMPAGLAKADAAALRKAHWRSVWPVAREVVGETVTPALAKLAHLAERVEWLEERQAQGTARYGGGNG